MHRLAALALCLAACAPPAPGNVQPREGFRDGRCYPTRSDPAVHPPTSVTRDESLGWYGNEALWLSLPPEGEVALSTKIGAYRVASGRLRISGERLDAPADPVAGITSEFYGDSGFTPSGISFPTAGCWRVTYELAGRELSFVLLAQGAATRMAYASLVLVLLDDGRLLEVSSYDGVVRRTLALGAVRSPPDNPWPRGQQLALGSDRRTLFALLAAASGADHIVAVDLATGVVTPVATLTTDVRYRALVLGARSGRLYLFGNRGNVAVVTLIERDGTRVLESELTDGEHDWLVYRALVSEDEEIAMVSYHGRDTTGAAVYVIGRGFSRACAARADPGYECVRIHGTIVPYRDGYLGTTGEGPIRFVGRDGAVRREYAPTLEANHLMEFAVDAPRARLFMVGSCLYRPGFGVIDLDSGNTQELSPSPAPCGELAAYVPGTQLVAVARASRGGLEFVSASSGRTRAALAVDGFIRDVLPVETSPSPPR